MAWLGCFGIGAAYALAAWGLQHTSVTHYALIYGLVPALTAVISAATGHERLTPEKIAGIGLSFIGCAWATTQGRWNDPSLLNRGDAVILAFVLLIAVHLVRSADAVKRHGASSANAVMLTGGTVLLLVPGGAALLEWRPASAGWGTVGLLLYIGLATGMVYLLRQLALRALTPTAVGIVHNLVPVSTLIFAWLFLGEAFTWSTVLGAATVLAGIHLVIGTGGRERAEEFGATGYAGTLLQVHAER
jgi:drug/metabolite transporter (DMT)-like permease